jgi:hypothetical protein
LYPETVLLRLISPEGKPMIKLGATTRGAGMTLIDSSDKGILLHAEVEGTSISISNGTRLSNLKGWLFKMLAQRLLNFAAIQVCANLSRFR